ncbi:hypothetical protein BGZ63DRAFT_420277 [Mariannaea sp. PMI_226]|nr:hypothetical protein BGZ63DRAFT_420277 [Mariannaea sp. PMI_226]
MKFSAIAAAAALAGVVAAKDSRTFAVLRFNDKQLTKGRADPIVSPGKVASHVHVIEGGNAFSLTSTGQDLTKSTCSNANVKGDNSAYWFPSLYFHDPKTGKFESVDLYYFNAYYFFEATNDQIKAFPVGLSMVSGDAMTRVMPTGGPTGNLDPSKGPLNVAMMTCPRTTYNPPSYDPKSDGTKSGVVNPNNQGEGVGFPDRTCDGLYSPLRADVHFPSCYNPAAGLTNYKSNMAFPQDAGNGKADCPKGWIHVPHLFFEAYWDTQKFQGRWEEGKGDQPFVFSNGDVTGYSSHADFIAAWDEDVLQHIIDTCDAGSSGMDQCPGVTKNTAACHIDSPVDEVTDGILTQLPGNNPLSGWKYGSGSGSSGSQPSSPGKTTVASDPTRTAEAISSHVTKTTTKTTTKAAPPKTTSTKSATKAATKPASHAAPKPTTCNAKTHTVYKTVTVTAHAPAQTKSTAPKKSHRRRHGRRGFN